MPSASFPRPAARAARGCDQPARRTTATAAAHAPRPGARVAGRVGGGKRKGRRVTERLRRSALVITASDGAAAGVREDTSGALVAPRLSDLGFAVERQVVPDDREAIEGALARRSRTARPDRDDGRDRAHAAGRDAAGDSCRHRLRRPGYRRGDARRRPGDHAARRPVAWHGRRPRPHPRHQPAGQPEGRDRIVRCHRAAAGARPRDARRTVRSRRLGP